MPSVRASRLPVAERAPLILDATLDLLAAKPGRGISMDEIAARAGVAKPSVYNCFGSREALFAALAEREEREIRELVVGSLGGLSPEASAEELLGAGLGAILASVAERPAGWRLVYPLLEPKEPSLAERIRAVRRDNLAATERMCRQYLDGRGAQAAGEKARLLAAMVAGVLDQLIERVLAEPERDARAEARRAAAVLAGGVDALVAVQPARRDGRGGQAA